MMMIQDEMQKNQDALITAQAALKSAKQAHQRVDDETGRLQAVYDRFDAEIRTLEQRSLDLQQERQELVERHELVRSAIERGDHNLKALELDRRHLEQQLHALQRQMERLTIQRQEAESELIDQLNEQTTTEKGSQNGRCSFWRAFFLVPLRGPSLTSF